MTPKEKLFAEQYALGDDPGWAEIGKLIGAYALERKKLAELPSS